MDIDNARAGELERRLGAQIRELRLRHNITQAELARRANIDRTTVGRIENGDGGSIGSLIQITRALNREDWLDSFAPANPATTPNATSPMQQLRDRQRRQATQRKRASRTPTRQ